MKKTILIIYLILAGNSTQALSHLQELSNTTVLKNADKVQKILISEGFEKVHFTTHDHINLCGLFLDQSDKKEILGTVIFIAGFYPGTKEGIATLYSMLADQPYNFLFFDARGHNESSGTFLRYTDLKKYGTCEYQDIVAAIDFVTNHSKTKKISCNIILHGICSGAFHAIKSIKHLSDKSCVKGILFDSGWSTLADIVEPTMAAQLYETLKDSWFSFLTKPFAKTLSFVYQLLFKAEHQKLAPITEDVKQITCPIFFIHSMHDSYTALEPVQNLAHISHKPTTWWIDSASHATCHLKHQSEYREKLKNFCSENLCP